MRIIQDLKGYQSFGDSLTVMTPTIALVFLSTTVASKKSLFCSFQTLISKFSPGKTWPVNLASIDCIFSPSFPNTFWMIDRATVP